MQETLPLFDTLYPQACVDIICADVWAWAEQYEGQKFHAMLCDPPYEISFMSKKWDGSGIAFKPETWKALAQHLLPGGFIFAFGGSRTYHRLACAMEDAGLILHSAIGWVNGAGFPKATKVMMDAIDGWAHNHYDGWCECDSE